VGVSPVVATRHPMMRKKTIRVSLAVHPGKGDRHLPVTRVVGCWVGSGHACHSVAANRVSNRREVDRPHSVSPRHRVGVLRVPQAHSLRGVAVSWEVSDLACRLAEDMTN
jgi:hypothetical protein